jgi:hypothetical protein
MAKRKPRTKSGKSRKIKTVMHEFKHGSLHSGRGKGGRKGKTVRSRKQAIAIAMSMAGKSKSRRRR